MGAIESMVVSVEGILSKAGVNCQEVFNQVEALCSILQLLSVN